MTFTNEERREVAARLRGLDEDTATLSHAYSKQEYDAMVLRAIRAVVGKGDVFHLLADLIDPTCEYVPIGGERFSCSECGSTVRLDFDVPVTDETPMPFKYCPNCGAEVVK